MVVILYGRSVKESDQFENWRFQVLAKVGMIVYMGLWIRLLWVWRILLWLGSITLGRSFFDRNYGCVLFMLSGGPENGKEGF